MRVGGLLWWALDEIRVRVTGRGARFSQVVLELAWNPGPGADNALAADVLRGGSAKRAQLWAPTGSVVFVAPGASAHPGVEPAVEAARRLWPDAVVTVVDEPVAALAGAALGTEPAACVVVHQDARRTSVAVVAGREAEMARLVPGGALGLAEAVAGHARTRHRLEVGHEQAWAAVVHGGAFAPSPLGREPGPVHGARIIGDGLRPRRSETVVLSATELREVMGPAYRAVGDAVARVLREVPPDTARRAAHGGVLLTGPHPPGAEDRVADLTGLPVHRVAEPDAGFDHPQVLLDGVDRLLAANPPDPAVPAAGPDQDDDASRQNPLMNLLRLLPPRDPGAGDQ
ncbi:rod shape-determining protein [Actinacidiphila alni]|uniref:rod shape-determining protein n=1 Tax=Actinacidiphila alni TaxID=380248 RepID=UPI0034515BD7